MCKYSRHTDPSISYYIDSVKKAVTNLPQLCVIPYLLNDGLSTHIRLQNLRDLYGAVCLQVIF